MKKLLTIAVILVSMIACNSKKSGNFVKKTESVVADTVKIDQSKQIDSLKNLLTQVTSTDYDLIVKGLKKMPEYQHAVFLTKVETNDYLSIISKLKDKYKLEKTYSMHYDKNWFAVNDSISVMDSYEYTVKIVFDTTQSLTPLITFGLTFWSDEKNIKTKVEDHSSSNYTFDLYYLPKLSISYVIVTGKHSGSERTYRENLFIFNREIRSLK